MLRREALADPRWSTASSRWQHRRELDALLAPYIATHDRWRLFESLTAGGVPAGPVQDIGDCFHCRHLRARSWFQRLTRSDIGSYDHAGSVFRWRSTPNPFWRASVRLGEDNEYIYREVLGYSEDEYQALLASGQVGTRFTDAVLAKNEA